MCAIDMCDPWQVVNTTSRTARTEHRCTECRRTIRPGETYHELSGLLDGQGWERHRTCRHCEALIPFMSALCGGYPIGDLFGELVEHFRDGYSSVQLGRWIACMRRRWHDGTDTVPADTGVHARALMERVAA